MKVTLKSVSPIASALFLFNSSAHATLMTPQDLGVSSVVTQAKGITNTSPEQISRAFLSRESLKLGLNSDLKDLELSGLQETPMGTVVRFKQIYQGLEVTGSDIVVTVANDEVVSFSVDYTKAQTLGKTLNATLSQEWAISKAYEELKLTASPQFQKIKQKVVIVNGSPRLVYLINLAAPVDHLYGWEMMLDADNGAILRSRSTLLNKKVAKPVQTNTFDPNPTIKSGHAYGTVSGYTDASNADSGFFTSQLTSITLNNLTEANGKVSLVGPNVQIVDIESPTNANCTVSSPASWNYTRNNPCFDQVSAYYFVDKVIQSMGTMGFKVHPIQYSGGLKVDPNGVDGDDNSHYDPSQDYLAFGQGGVHDAQDHDVVIHELGHALHEWLTKGHASQTEGLGEGIGDYNAASYDRSFVKPGDVAYNWTFSYDGHNEFWPGRITNVTGTYPDAAQGEIHDAGQLWATTCIEILDAITKPKADKIFWSAIAQLSDSSSQLDAAKAYVAAAKKLYSSDAKLVSTVISSFVKRGYQVQ